MSTYYKPRHKSRATKGEARPPKRSLDAVSPAPCTYSIDPASIQLTDVED